MVGQPQVYRSLPKKFLVSLVAHLAVSEIGVFLNMLVFIR